MRRATRRAGGSALFLVLSYTIVLVAVGIAWEAAARRALIQGARGPARARARAAAESVWAEARAALARGEAPRADVHAVPGGAGVATVGRPGPDGRFRVLAVGRARHGREVIEARLELLARRSDAGVVVLSREERP